MKHKVRGRFEGKGLLLSKTIIYMHEYVQLIITLLRFVRFCGYFDLSRNLQTSAGIIGQLQYFSVWCDATGEPQ